MPTKSKLRGLKEGYRSGLEEITAAAIKDVEGFVEYEGYILPFTQPEKRRTYRPDFVLSNFIVVETKGRLTVQDRQKHVWLKQQYPELDLRFVFYNANARLSKRSKTTYREWAEENGFLWSHKVIPAEWFEEPENKASKKVIKDIARKVLKLKKKKQKND